MKISAVATTPNVTSPSVDAEYEIAINNYFAAMEDMKTEMDERQSRIEQMQRETDSMLGSLFASEKSGA